MSKFSENIQQHIFLGEFDSAKTKINERIKNKIDTKDRSELFYLLGNISKLEGDIDEALIHWQKSNQYRSKIYPHGDYHLAWNYALLSNYHYEKINTELAVDYADSCLQIISGLTLLQQREIEVFKTWNILGQSYKQSNKALAQDFYLKSVNFIKSNNIDEHYLAETYHLLGNSYLDMTHLALVTEPSDALSCYQLSSKYYGQSISIWKQLYGTEHYELARTYFVQGLLNYYVNDRLGLSTSRHSMNLFELAFSAYGIDLSGDVEYNLDKIPNKEDFLMTCKYLTLAYFREFQKDLSIEWIDKAEKVNGIAIKTWENIHFEFNSINTNQNLAIYNLVPFSEAITIEMFRKKLSMDYSLDNIFSANQKLKYYDLLKYGSEGDETSSEINIPEFQQRLKSGEVFLDFHISLNTKSIIVLRIANESVELIELPYLENGLVEEYLKVIQSFDFDAYTKSAYKIYQGILEPCKVGNNNLILCLDGWLNSIPFEALLTSKNNWNKKDYRKLDYMLMQNRIQYVLNPRLFRKEQSKIFDFSMEVYIPDNSAYSSLPFSQKLGTNFKKKFNAQVYSSIHATKQNFLNSKSPIVHLSGHGVISSEDALSNYLVFSDSLLYLEDLAGLGNIPALVVLNTCNSANGKMYYGDGINGFVRAFHRLGSNSTMSNLWEVDDQASNQLLERFYGFLSNSISSDEALHLAQLEIIQQAKSSNMASPYYWAGHRLTGDEIVFEGGKKDQRIRHWFYWLFLLPIIAVGGWFWLRKVGRKHA